MSGAVFRGLMLTMLFAGVALPSLADAPAPDDTSSMAPVVERVMARCEGFELSVGIRSADGERFRPGTYDVSVIQSGDSYYLQLIHRVTRRGIRLPATVRGRTDARMATSDESKMEVRNAMGQSTFVFQTSSFTAESVLKHM